MFCIPFKQRRKKCQRDVCAGDERSSCLLKSLHTDAPSLSPTTIPATSETPKKVKKTSWWHLWPVYKKKKNKTSLKQDVVEVTIPSPSVTEKSCSTSITSHDGEVGVLVRASPPSNNLVFAHNELKLQSDHRDETADSVQSLPTTEEAVKCIEVLEDIEDGDLGGSPTSYTDEHQTNQDSKAEKTILPSATEQIIDNQKDSKEGEADVPDNIRPAPKSPDKVVFANTTLLSFNEKECYKTSVISALDNTSVQFGVQEETLPDGDIPSPLAREKGSHTVKEHWAEKVFLASSARKQSPDSEIGCKGDSSIHPSPASRETENDKKIKMTLWFILVQLFYDKRVFPVEGEEVTHMGPSSGSATASVSVLNEIQQNASPRSDLFITGSNGHKNMKLKSGALAEMDTKMSGQTSSLDHIRSLQAEFSSPGLTGNVYKRFAKPFLRNKETVSNKELVCLGLPNLGFTCYINSTLQSLLTLSSFVQEIHNQILVWSSHPKSKLFRAFLDIGLCRFSDIREEKRMVMSFFKRTVAEFNSDFDDGGQKDAHEFLICVLDTMRSLSPEMQLTAANFGLTYSCPVAEHIALQILNTRTCRGCGEQSHTVEDFVNLSLDLVPGGSVNQCLQEYLKEAQLEYTCHCGVQHSSLKSSFLTLPNLLILHLKRFTFTGSNTVKKIKKPITLSRELVVKEEFMTTRDTTAHYSLVSVVSHIGPRADSGHYISDSIHRRQDMGDTVESWLTYDDERVSQTTGEAVCSWRETNAFLLFYEKQPLKS